MGNYCAALRSPALSNFQRRKPSPPTPPKAPVAAGSGANVRDRETNLRANLSFEQGFALGMKVHKLQRILAALDEDPVNADDPDELLDNIQENKTWCTVSHG